MLVLQGQVTKFNTMADGSGRLQVDLQELTPDQFAEVGRVNKKSGVLVFKPDVDQISEKEKEAISKINLAGLGDRKKKSKSQVLRQVMYLLHKQDPEGFDTQEEHYNHYMDQIINHFKDKIEEL